MVNMPANPEKTIADLKPSLSKEEISMAIILASDYSDVFLLVTASLHARLVLGIGIREDIEESIRDSSKSLTNEERKNAQDLGKTYQESVLQLAALYARQRTTRTFLATDEMASKVCDCYEDQGCQCHSDQRQRDLPVYREYVPDPAEIRVLCDPCRQRLEDALEMRIVPAGTLPIELSQFPGSSID